MKLKLFVTALCLSAACAVTAGAAEVTSTGAEGEVKSDAKVESQYSMLAVNPGDTINIEVSGAGESLTLISYKQGEEPGSETIQYVNQYAAEIGDEPQENATYDYTINYVVRDITYGVYCLKINNGTGDGVETVYYKVGAPKAELGEYEGTTTTYFKRINFDDTGDKDNDVDSKNTTSVAYLSTIMLNGDSILEYGYDITYDGKNVKPTKKDFSDIDGMGEIKFGITVYGFDTKTFDTDFPNLKVKPFVNYKVTNAVEEGK